MKIVKDMQNLNRRSGFTLVEMAVAAFITLVMLGGVYLVLAAGRDAWQIGDSQLELAQDLRKLSDRLDRELSESNAARLTAVGGVITFQVPVDADGDGDVVDNADNIEWGATLNWACTQPGAGCYAQNWQIRYALVGTQLIRSVWDAAGVEQQNLRSVSANNITIFTPVETATGIDINITAAKSTWRGFPLQSSITKQIGFRN